MYFIASLIREYVRILILGSISYLHRSLFYCTPLNTDEYWKIRGLTFLFIIIYFQLRRNYLRSYIFVKRKFVIFLVLQVRKLLNGSKCIEFLFQTGNERVWWTVNIIFLDFFLKQVISLQYFQSILQYFWCCFYTFCWWCALKPFFCLHIVKEL